MPRWSWVVFKILAEYFKTWKFEEREIPWDQLVGSFSLAYNQLVKPCWFIKMVFWSKIVESLSRWNLHEHCFRVACHRLKKTFVQYRLSLAACLSCRKLALATWKPIYTPCARILLGVLASPNCCHCLVFYVLYVLRKIFRRTALVVPIVFQDHVCGPKQISFLVGPKIPAVWIFFWLGHYFCKELQGISYWYQALQRTRNKAPKIAKQPNPTKWTVLNEIPNTFACKWMEERKERKEQPQLNQTKKWMVEREGKSRN